MYILFLLVYFWVGVGGGGRVVVTYIPQQL